MKGELPSQTLHTKKKRTPSCGRQPRIRARCEPENYSQCLFFLNSSIYIRGEGLIGYQFVVFWLAKQGKYKEG